MQQYFILGKNGQIESDFIEYQQLLEMTRAPLAEINLIDLMHKPLYLGRFGNNVLGKIGIQYLAWGKFGPNGDVISILKENEMYIINLIAPLAFPKPGLTADIVPFVRDKNGQLFFIGIIRKNNPGKGKPALIGGFRNVEGDHFDTAIETIIKESWEEVRMRIIPKGDGVYEAIENDINLAEFPALVDIASAKLLTTIRLVGAYPTSEEERMPMGYKRVYETTAYACLINFPKEFDEKTLAAKFKASDDAQGMFVWNITKKGIPELAFGHHNVILNSALKIIR